MDKSRQKVDKYRKSGQKWTDVGQEFGPAQTGPIGLNRNPATHSQIDHETLANIEAVIWQEFPSIRLSLEV